MTFVFNGLLLAGFDRCSCKIWYACSKCIAKIKYQIKKFGCKVWTSYEQLSTDRQSKKNHDKTVCKKTFVSQQWEHEWSQNLVSLLKKPYWDRKPSFRALPSRLVKLHTVLAWPLINSMTITNKKTIDQNCLFLDNFNSDGSKVLAEVQYQLRWFVKFGFTFFNYNSKQTSWAWPSVKNMKIFISLKRVNAWKG